MLAGGCAPPGGAESADGATGGAPVCEVTSQQGIASYTAQVRGTRSVIDLGMNEVEVELRGETVERLQGPASEPVGTVTAEGATVKHQFVEAALRPIVNGRTSIEDGQFQHEFSSANCTDQELRLGAVHLSVFFIRRANGGS